MKASAAVLVSLAILGACSGGTDPSATVVGTYTLIEENGDSVPSDPSAPFGCCITLNGSIAFTATTYDLRTRHQNKNNSIVFDNSEQGTFSRQGNTLVFVRTGGEGFPYLLAPGTVSDDGRTVVLMYGDEGPGSDQIRATFQR